MKRIRLTDSQCRLFAKDMRDFGYDVSFDEVRRIADSVAEGTHSPSDVIAVIMCNQIDEAMEAAKNSRRPSR